MPFTLQAAEDDKFNVLDHTLQIVNKRGPMEKKEADKFLESHTQHENHREEMRTNRPERIAALKEKAALKLKK